jgi:hypothetical protein
MIPEPGVKEGDRIELLSMPEDPDPIPSGTKGTVQNVVKLWDNKWQIQVKWDSGRTLSLIHPVDTFKKAN